MLTCYFGGVKIGDAETGKVKKYDLSIIEGVKPAFPAAVIPLSGPPVSSSVKEVDLVRSFPKIGKVL